MKRRNFMRRMLAGAGGGLLLGLPGISRACSRTTGPAGMILIPAGEFLMGTTSEQVQKLAAEYGYHPSWLESEAPQREVNLPDYSIVKYPVSNKQ